MGTLGIEHLRDRQAENDGGKFTFLFASDDLQGYWVSMFEKATCNYKIQNYYSFSKLSRNYTSQILEKEATTLNLMSLLEEGTVLGRGRSKSLILDGICISSKASVAIKVFKY